VRADGASNSESVASTDFYVTASQPGITAEDGGAVVGVAGPQRLLMVDHLALVSSRMTTARTLCLMLFVAVLLTTRDGLAEIAESTSFVLDASSFSCAGGVAASETFSVVGTVGDSSPVGSAVSANFAVDSGFPGAQPACTGDCNGDEQVTVDELITAVNIALGTRPVADCVAADVDRDGQVAVNELVTAVNRALAGC
jgi:hypothetical protein